MGYYYFLPHTGKAFCHKGSGIRVVSGDTYRAAYRRFREQLRRSRQEAGLTQVEAARLLGRPQSFVSKVESGERRLDFVELQMLARIYGKSLSYFQDEALTE